MFAYLFISSFNGYGTDDSRQRSLWGMGVLAQVGSSNIILWEQILAGSNFFVLAIQMQKNMLNLTKISHYTLGTALISSKSALYNQNYLRACPYMPLCDSR